MTTPALELKGITKRYGNQLAVDRVDLTVPRNQVVALVGESGSGKTTTGLLALRLIAATAGQILLEGEDISRLGPRALKPYRRRMQVVFQDSYASLDPMMTLGEIVAEPLGIHAMGTAAERRETAAGWLEKVGLDGGYANRYPHELSGGQRQRVSVARALILGASVLVADEPTSALDVSVKAQIVNLLQGLQADMGLSMLFISHDLSVVRSLADEVVVMLRGRVVERAPTDRIFSNARHPYTQTLLDAVPVIDPTARRRRTFMSAEEVTARTPRLRPDEIDPQPLLDTAEPQLVALAGSHFVEAIVAEKGEVMTGFIVRRVISMAVTFIIVSVAIFLMMHAIPGGPFDGYEMPLPDDIKARMMAQLGLDKPLWEQYLRYMWGALHFDFGVPYQSPGDSVMGLIAHAWLPSFVLGGLGIVIGAPIGILLGMAAALRRNSIIDYVASAIATLGLTIPVFIISTGLIMVFAVWLKWTPASGWGEPKRWILPIMAYAAVPLATYARYARSTMLDALNKPFVSVLRAKGLSERRIIFQHVLRNAAIPMVTIFPVMFVGIATGSIFVEAMFRVPGLGAYFVSSINKRDYPLEMALMLLISALYSVSYLAADILYAILNPRIRVDGRSR